MFIVVGICVFLVGDRLSIFCRRDSLLLYVNLKTGKRMGIYAEYIYIYIQHLSKEGAGYSLFFQMHINSSVFPFALLWQEEIHKLHFPDSLQLDFCLVLPLRGTTGILAGEKKGETTFLRHSGSVTSNGSDSRSDSRCSGSCGWLA